MANQVKINKEGFRLIVESQNQTRIVAIPETKRGVGNRTVGGRKTYLMAIDAFTTQFKDKIELLDYIKQNGLAKLPTADYNDLNIKIEYIGPGKFTGNLNIMYSGQQDLINFINNHTIQEHFSHDDPSVQEFWQSIIDYWTSGLYQAEYKIFMTDYNNRYFGIDLINTLTKVKKENKMKMIKEERIPILSLSRYHNLRGYYMTKKTLEDTLFKITREKIWSYQDRIEYEREERLKQEQPKPSIKLDVVKIPEAKTKISEKQLPKQQSLFDDSLFFNIDETPKTR